MTTSTPVALIEVDATFAFGEGRLPEAVFDGLEQRLAGIRRRTTRERARGDLAFLRLGERTEDAEAIARWRKSLPPFDDALILGIGGSALGARVFDALRPDPAGLPRLHVVDTVDPDFVGGLLARLDPARTVAVGISLSGTTLETAATFLVVEDWLRRAHGASAPARIAVVSGEEPNPLAHRAADRGYAGFSIPKGVGGRYSALSAAGLVPASLSGIDPLRLLSGARSAAERCVADDPRNPAHALARLHYLAQWKGKSVAILWTYAARLEPLGPWWVQLVGESLGKKARERGTGVTPVAARGPADQHSLLQLVLDGPRDKFTLFLDARSGGRDLTVPSGGDDLSPVGGKGLGRILAAEREATEYALAHSGRPSASIRLRAADPESVAAFLVTAEAAVTYWGRFLRVNPFDQPAVALGKTAAMASLLGRPPDAARAIAAHRATTRRTYA
jgi:glucose-6-phosphate isomerase